MDLNNNTRLLVVAAHPDDEVLGCGGTLAKATHLNAKVKVVFLGEGVSARFDIGDYNNSEFLAQSKQRTNESISALKSLGIYEYSFSNRLCCQFDSRPILELVKEIESHFDDFKPNIVLTHNPSEVNIDHQITYRAVETACRPNRNNCPDEVYTFEIPCSGSWTFDTTFKPNVYVNITPFWDKKINAWKCYEGEARPFPFPRSTEGLKTLAQYRGMASNLELAEAFKLSRRIIK